MIILSSYGFRQIITSEKICDELKNTSGSMLIIPLASESPDIASAEEKKGAVKCGFSADKIDIYTHSNHDIITKKNYDNIAVLGGNTFRLLYFVKKYGLDEFIKSQISRGSNYLGFSAGAYLLCKNLEYVKQFDDDNYICTSHYDYSGLDIINECVICHYDFKGFQAFMGTYGYFDEKPKILKIKNDEVKVIKAVM